VPDQPNPPSTITSNHEVPAGTQIRNRRDIDGFPGYQISDDGTVWTAWQNNGNQPRKLSAQWRPMRPGRHADGYPRIDLYRDGLRHSFAVHTLILSAFIGPRPRGMEACHNDGDPRNSVLSNLRWDTHLNNTRDCLKHGTATYGVRNGKAKLTTEHVVQIRVGLAAGVRKLDLARKWRVAPSTISAIARKANWAWLA
jgi:hypothetical protein